MVGGTGEADAYAEIDFPLWIHVQIDGGENLVLLLAKRQELCGRTDGAVVFEATGDFFGEVVANLEIGREDEAVANAGAVKRLVEGRIEGEIQAAELLIDDRAHFPGPGVGREFSALITDFVGKTEADRPVPFFRDAEARANMVADPLHALSVLGRSEDVEASLEPVGEAMRDLDGFVELMVGGEYTGFGNFGPLEGEVAV